MQSSGENRCARSLLSEALSSELCHTVAVVDGVLGLYNDDWEMTVEECDALMTDIEKITSRLRQLGRLIVFKCHKDHKNKMKKQLAADRLKLALEEAHGLVTREAQRIIEFEGSDWPHPPSAT